MKSKTTSVIKPKKQHAPKHEDLIQRYLNATHPQEKRILLGLIRLKDPNFKEIK